MPLDILLAPSIPAPTHLQQPPLLDEEGLDKVHALMLQLAVGQRLDRCGIMVTEHLNSGGKRLRARLAIATVRALGGELNDAIGWAAAVELLHNASLVHDDLQDGDRVRRGKPTTWARHGIGQAVNAGDLLLMLPTLAAGQCPVSNGTRWLLAQELASYAAETVRGQSLDMALLSMRRLSWQDYSHAVQGKTAALLALPVHGAALIAGRSEERASDLASAFRDLGFLFQVQDDILDLYGDKGRDRPGSDIREGKVSALVVQHLEMYPEEQDWVCEVLERPREETTDAEVELARCRFRDGGALEELLERIYHISTSLFQSPILAREPVLHQVASAMLERMLRPIRHLDPSLPTMEEM